MSSESRLVVHQPRRSAGPAVHKDSTPAAVSKAPTIRRRIKAQQRRQPYDSQHWDEVYRRAPVAGEAEYRLCPDCASINFEAIYNIDPSTIKTLWAPPVIDLDHVRELTASSCSLCRFFWCTMKNLRKKGEWGPWHQGGSWKLSILNTEKYSGTPDDALMLCITNSRNTADEAVEFGLIATGHWRTDRTTHPIVGARLNFLETESLDYEFITTELGACVAKPCARRQYPDVELSIASLVPSGMKLIDCNQSRLVRADSTMSFFTLSYVWGARNPQPSQTSGRGEIDILEDAPLTIRDAMTVTLKLGYRYLWVDRYCIDQFDEKGKMAQIHGMASIFGSCVATIVALGANDQSGLPGVSSRRNKADLVKTPHCTLLSIGPGVRETVAASPWNSRGWTWQESLLSPRLIIFGKGQVFLTCNSGTVIDLWGTRMGGAGSFGNALREYTARSLTYESDSLNAFRGYLNTCGLYSCCGVPIFHVAANRHQNRRGHGDSEDQRIDPRLDWTWLSSLSIGSANNLLESEVQYLSHAFGHVGFCAGLVWYHIASKKPLRSTLVPSSGRLDQVYCSWSWTSCYGPTDLMNCFHDYVNLHDVLFAPEVSLECDGRSTMTLNAHLYGRYSNHYKYEPLPEMGTVIRLRSRLTTFRILGVPEANFLSTDTNLGVTLDWSVLEGVNGQSDDPYSSNTTFSPDHREQHQHRWNSKGEGHTEAGHAILVYWERYGDEGAPGPIVKAYWIAVQFDVDRQCWCRVGLIVSTIHDHELSWKRQKMLVDAIKVEVAELKKGDCLQVLRIR